MVSINLHSHGHCRLAVVDLAFSSGDENKGVSALVATLRLIGEYRAAEGHDDAMLRAGNDFQTCEGAAGSDGKYTFLAAMDHGAASRVHAEPETQSPRTFVRMR